MRSSFGNFFSAHRRTLLSLIFGLVFSATLAYAVPPSTQYTPGATLDPTCAPGDTNCSVLIPQSQWSDVSGGISYAGGNVGIGTSSPLGIFDVKPTTAVYDINLGDINSDIGGIQIHSENVLTNNFVNISAANGLVNIGDLTGVGNGTKFSLDPSVGKFTFQNGNVGINTTTPSALLHISGQNPNNYAYLLGGDSSIYYNSLAVRLEDNGEDNFGATTINMNPEEGISLYAQRGVYYTNFYTNPYSSSISNQYGTQFAIEDTGNYSLVKLGDVNWNGNGSRLVINDIDKTINLGLSESSAADGIEGIQIQLDSTNHPTVKVGSTAFYGNGTNLTVDDASATISLNSGCTYFGRNYIGTVYMSDDCYGGDIGLRNGLNDESIAVYYPSTNSYRYGGDSLYVYSDSDGGFGGDTVNGINLNKQFSYINFNADAVAAIGSAGYGFRDNAGVMEFKNNGGSWSGFGGGGGSGAISYVNNSYVGQTSGPTGDGTTGAEQYNIFIGDNAGYGLPIGEGVYYSNFLGVSAGYNAVGAFASNFFGSNAGNGASYASESNFLGSNAGQNATNAFASNFLGSGAGLNAINAGASNFFGYSAGRDAVSAGNSNFLGVYAGNGATNAGNSNFFGPNAGNGAINAVSTNLFGNQAGQNATNAANSIFIGTNSGINDTVNNTAAYDDSTTFANTSILIGHKTSTGGFSNSIALGAYATNTATSQLTIGSDNRRITSIRIGGGQGTASADSTIFIGDNAGVNATSASYSMFFGDSAGSGATNAAFSNFLGFQAGSGATNALLSNFFGLGAGAGATNANNSNFFGPSVGFDATNANNSNFFGKDAGSGATNAANSTFIGQNAGRYNGISSLGTVNAANSIFLGTNAGYLATDLGLNNTAAYDDTSTFANTSILIGHKTSTGGFSNSIAIGAYATNTATNQLTIGSDNRKIRSIRIGGGQGNASANNTIFIGDSAGANATYVYESNFIGSYAGQDAASVYYSNFLGNNAGNGATYAYNSNFLGSYAGLSATNANYSNFIGNSAGQNATNANNANFIGISAGLGATNANYSNFLGYTAGYGATSANNANFIGSYAGNGAIYATNSTFIGQNAGRYFGNDSLGTTNAAHSIFIGTNAGYLSADIGLDNTTNADDYSILIGNNTSTGGFENSIALGANATNTASNQFMIGSTTRPINQVVINGSSPYLNFGTTGGTSGYGIRDNAGVVEYKNSGGSWAGFGGSSSPITIVNTSSLSSTGLTGTGTGSTATNSIFLGTNAGNSATSANNSNFLGNQAGQNASSAYFSNFFGNFAGNGATSANDSNFLGNGAGSSATGAFQSNFLGPNAGALATNASNSNFFGYHAGTNATNASVSNFFGYNAGAGATSAVRSNFIGEAAGASATSASYSNFLGPSAGNNATNATRSNFLGAGAGLFSTNASYSNFLGSSAGQQSASASNSIFIGSYSGYLDTINNTAAYDDTTTFANTSILLGHRTKTGGFSNSIAIGAYATNTATNQFMIGSANRPIDTTRWNGSSSTQCTITTGTGIACTSDERLKTNVVDLPSSTLESLLSVKTVTYNWSAQPDGSPMIGFLAQDLETHFPQLVATDKDGYKSVYYAQMTPILVEAIREMNIKIGVIPQYEDQTMSDRLAQFFRNIAETGLGMFTKVTTDELCIKSTCVTEQQLQDLLLLQAQLRTTSTSTPPEATTPFVVDPTNTPQVAPEPTPEISTQEPTVPEVVDETISVPTTEPVQPNL